MAPRRNPGDSRGAPPSADPDAGTWGGRSVARRFVSPDGMTVLVGRTAADNDILSLRLGAPRDFWFHVAGESGSHVVVRNPQNLDRLPRDTERFAASLAARHSKARNGGRVAVHVTTCAEVSKPRGAPAGQVALGRFRSVQATPGASEPATAPESGSPVRPGDG
jgi:predicted ribosome quality control (RQC) complex YloA/Tae2 family protein